MATMKRFLKQFSGIVLATFTWIFIALDTLFAFVSIALLKPFDWNGKITYRIANLWGKLIVQINPFWRITVSGKSHIKKNTAYILVANHTSLADIVCLYCLGKNFKWIAKASLFKIPFFGWTMSLLGYIPLKRGEHGSIRDSFQEAQKCLEQGTSVLFFPEGTRSRSGTLSEFKNGAFKLALLTQKPIVPIVIRGTGQALSKGKAAMATKVKGSIKVLPPIEVAHDQTEDFEALKKKVWNLMNEELANAET